MVVVEGEVIVTPDADASLVGPVLELPSTTESPVSKRITNPSTVQTTVTVMVDVVDAADGVMLVHDVFPTTRKSAASIPLTGSVNVNVYDNVIELDGEEGAEIETPGAVPSATELLVMPRENDDTSLPAASWTAGFVFAESTDGGE